MGGSHGPAGAVKYDRLRRALATAPLAADRPGGEESSRDQPPPDTAILSRELQIQIEVDGRWCQVHWLTKQLHLQAPNLVQCAVTIHQKVLVLQLQKDDFHPITSANV